MSFRLSHKTFFGIKFWILIILFGFGCYPSEDIKVDQYENEDLIYTELDDYLNVNFVEKYGMAVRYRYRDNYVAIGQRTVPVDLEYVIPMTDFLQTYWINPYLSVENGEAFFVNHVPAQVVLLGGYIFDGGGIVLGFADAGASITLLNVNSLDFDDPDWIKQQLNIIYHEFAHVVHQRYRMPPGFETITPTSYTGPGSWYTLNDDDALQRGFVTPYATSDVKEDFAEMVSFYLFDKDFESKFLTLEEGCTDVACERRNEGRTKIKQKLSSIADHYEKVTGINLDALREATQAVIVN